MFIRKRRFRNVINDIYQFIGELTNNQEKIKDILKEQEKDIRMLKLASMSQLKAAILQDKKIINLVEIVKFLTADKDKDFVIAIAKDGTELTVGDFLDAEDLFPHVEEEFNVANFIKQV